MRFFRKSWKYQVTTVIKYLFLILVAIVSLYPFIWVLISSFKDNNSIFGDPFGLPVKIAFENYKEVWAGADVGRNFFNSMIVCLTTLVILIIITSMGCYILTRVWKNRFLSTYFSLGIMIPIHALLIPSVLIFKKIGLTDNLFSLVLMYTAINISLSMYIMNGFFDSIPREMDEAATIDGCSRSQIPTHYFPNCKAWNCYGCHSGVFELLERSTYGTCSDFISAKENFISCDFCIKGFLCYTIWSPVCRICNFHSSGCYYVSAFPETGYCRNDSRCSERIMVLI